MPLKFFLSLLLALIFSFNAHSQKVALSDYSTSLHWNLQAGFQSPESVVYDADRKVFYVSNGVGFEKNGLGFITKVSEEGRLIDLKWIEGLNRPTGMALSDGKLFVADIDELLSIDVDDEKIIARYQTADANPLLNDVSCDEEGNVYATGSASNKVYVLKEGRLAVFVADDKKLKYANGICFDQKEMLVVGWHFLRYSLEKKKLKFFGDQKTLQDLDGLCPDGTGGYFCSAVGGNGLVWRVDARGKARLLLKYGNYCADMDYIPSKNLLVIATGNHQTGTYALSAFRVIPN